MLKLLWYMMLIILLRKIFKGMQLDPWLLKQLSGCGSANGGRPLHSLFLLASQQLPHWEAGGSGAEGLGASGHELKIKEVEVHELKV